MSIESFERRALLVKAEVTEGTDSVPTAGTNAIQVLNGTSGITSEKIERNLDRAWFGADPFINTRYSGFIEGDFELAPASGAGNIANPLAAVLLIGGMAETLAVGPPAQARYNVISTALPSASCYFYHSGTLKKLLASRANISGINFTIGRYPMLKARIQGLLDANDVTEVAVPTGTYTAFQAPEPITHVSSSLSINSVLVEGISMNVDFNNELSMVEHTEGLYSRIKDRKPTGTMKFHKPLKATLDPWALWRAGTVVTCFFRTVNSGATRKSEIRVLAQLEEPREVNEDGNYVIEQPFRCIPGASGNDELILEFGEIT